MLHIYLFHNQKFSGEINMQSDQHPHQNLMRIDRDAPSIFAPVKMIS